MRPQVAVTVEPLGGSPTGQPTSTPIFVARAGELRELDRSTGAQRRHSRGRAWRDPPGKLGAAPKKKRTPDVTTKALFFSPIWLVDHWGVPSASSKRFGVSWS